LATLTIHLDVEWREQFIVEGFATTRFRATELITILTAAIVSGVLSVQRGQTSIEVALRPRNGSAAVCSRCHFAGARLAEKPR
jgi:hypothetical protein